MQNKTNQKKFILEEEEVSIIFNPEDNSKTKQKKIFEIITFSCKNEEPELISDNEDWTEENKMKLKVLQQFCQELNQTFSKDRDIEINFSDSILDKLKDYNNS